MARAGIALGSNVGDRLALLRDARDRLRKLHHGEAESFLVSPIYETDPVGCEPGTPAFLNAVIELETRLAPDDLLDATQAIEHDLGRPDRRPKNAPRTIDVDLLYIGAVEIATERLVLPHPRLADRRFVLAPLVDIVPGLRLPGRSVPVSALLETLVSDEPQPLLTRETW